MVDTEICDHARRRMQHVQRPPRTAVQAYLGLGEAEALRALAGRKDVPVTVLIRQAVRQLLEREGQP